ncbi:MAG: metal-dependent hydrolase [Campylobacterota bacterium]|nr:metal-dependent hydrolase [Campylobacterota bacterium]
MKLLSASWVITCDENNTIIKNGGVVFDQSIIDVGNIDYLREKYPNLSIPPTPKNSVLIPGLINPHVHLEFSANTTTLQYGNFNQWLDSVIEHREELIEQATTELMSEKLNQMIQTGTTTIGAISSYGFDLDACAQSPMNTVYFTEAIGSKADMIDTLFVDFKAKLGSAQARSKHNFIPAVAIHSPYSVHPFLIREILNIAKDQNMPVSAHFLESFAEKQWLNEHCGEFAAFFNNFLNQTRSLCEPFEFLQLFKGVQNLSFTHCVQANEEELSQIKQLNATIIHCPVSNRLLTNTMLDLNKLNDINLAIGTDGLSSNISLNLFDELRHALLMHSNQELNLLAQKLLQGATTGGAKALGLTKKGTLKNDFDADIVHLQLPNSVEEEKNLIAQLLLHPQNILNTYIKGEAC